MQSRRACCAGIVKAEDTALQSESGSTIPWIKPVSCRAKVASAASTADERVDDHFPVFGFTRAFAQPAQQHKIARAAVMDPHHVPWNQSACGVHQEQRHVAFGR